MLSKNLRLPKEEFHARGYHTVRTPHFLLKAKKNTIGNTRIGVVVGMAVSKSAVKRNFWKRETKAVLLGATRRESQDLLAVISPKANELTKKQFIEKLSDAVARIAQ